jgi:hypothetical protein
MATRRVSPANRSSGRAAHWQSLIAAWSKSGLSQRAFCARRGILPGTLAWWKHQLSSEIPVPSRRRPASARFVRVELRPGATGAEVGAGSATSTAPVCSPPALPALLELVFPDGLRVRIGAGCDPELVGRVLAALRSGRC